MNIQLINPILTHHPIQRVEIHPDTHAIRRDQRIETRAKLKNMNRLTLALDEYERSN
jgi:hypothetical protein